MEQARNELPSEDHVTLGYIEPTQLYKPGIEILDQYVESLKLKALSRVSSCINCGACQVQLISINKKDKSKGYVCKTCLMSDRRR